MTYSVELFICMVAGLLVGHAIFNTGLKIILTINFGCQKVSRFFHLDAEVGESVDPCCASQTIATSSSDKLDDEM